MLNLRGNLQKSSSKKFIKTTKEKKTGRTVNETLSCFTLLLWVIKNFWIKHGTWILQVRYSRETMEDSRLHHVAQDNQWSTQNSIMRICFTMMWLLIFLLRIQSDSYHLLMLWVFSVANGTLIMKALVSQEVLVLQHFRQDQAWVVTVWYSNNAKQW